MTQGWGLRLPCGALDRVMHAGWLESWRGLLGGNGDGSKAPVIHGVAR